MPLTSVSDTDGPRPARTVHVTVLIVTRDRADSLSRTLEGLGNQELGDLSWEIIVVDNGSSDHTSSVLSSAAHSLPLITLWEPMLGKNRALNQGLPKAQGELLVFTDDDVEPAPDWIRALVDAAARWPQDNIFGGAIVPRFPDNTPAWMMRADFPHTGWAFSGYHPRALEGPTSVAPLGPNLAIRARALAGTLFDESMGPQGSSYPMGSEVEFLRRLYRRGEQFIFVPDAQVRHVLRPEHVTKANLTTRAFRLGRGVARIFPGVSSLLVFGIPFYHVKGAIAVTLRLAVSPLRPRRARWIAVMEFHEMRGNIWQRIAMLRGFESREDESAAERQPLFSSRKAIATAVKRRGLWGILASLATWPLRPLVRLQRWRLFESELVASASGGTRGDGVVIEVFRGVESGRSVRVALCRLEVIGPEEIEDRLACGDSVAIAFADENPIGYAWCAYSDYWATDLGRQVRVGRTEVVGYDGFVLPNWRGRRLLPDLDAAQMAFGAQAGRKRQLVYAAASNRAAIRSLEAMGKKRVLTLYRLVIPALAWTLEWKRGKGLAP